MTKVLMAQADKLQEVQEASEGEIVVVVGFKHVSFCKIMYKLSLMLWATIQTFTGDVLVKSPTVAKLLESGSGLSLLAPPTVPSPVFLCTVEPSSSTHQRSVAQFPSFTMLAIVFWCRVGASSAEPVSRGSQSACE